MIIFIMIIVILVMVKIMTNINKNNDYADDDYFININPYAAGG